jgi:hypothetical protein
LTRFKLGRRGDYQTSAADIPAFAAHDALYRTAGLNPSADQRKAERKSRSLTPVSLLFSGARPFSGSREREASSARPPWGRRD